MLIAFLLLSSCCTNLQPLTIDPALSFAKVPDPIDESGTPIVILGEDKNKVEMPLHYWQAVARYILKTEKVKKQYKAWHKIEFEEQ